MPRVTHVKRAVKPNSVVTQQDIDDAKSGKRPDAAAYYWWKFRYGGKRYSKNRPRASQLTQSNYYSSILSLLEDIEDTDTLNIGQEELESMRDEWVSQINDIASECQDSLDNMPESLQDAPTGELLQQRVQSMEEWADELESVDIDFEPQNVDCPECDGGGEVDNPNYDPDDEESDEKELIACDNCNGTGEVEDEDWPERWAMDVLEELRNCEPNIE